MEQLECSLHGVVQNFDELKEFLSSFCIGGDKEYCFQYGYATTIKEMGQKNHLRFIKRHSTGDHIINNNEKWLLEYLGNRVVRVGDYSGTIKLDKILYDSVLIRPIVPSYVSPKPNTFLQGLGFKITAEFIRNGIMFINENITCILSQIYSMKKQDNIDDIIPFDSTTWHVEIINRIDKGGNLVEPSVELVQFAVLLKRWVTFPKVNIYDAYANVK